MRTIIDPKLVDWSDCPLVERNPLKPIGVPIVKHARVQADSIVENFESRSPSKKSLKISESKSTSSASWLPAAWPIETNPLHKTQNH